MTIVAEYTLHVRYRKSKHDIVLPIADPSCEQLAAAITSATTADQETIKLSTPGKAGALISLQAHLGDSVSQVGK